MRKYEDVKIYHPKSGSISKEKSSEHIPHLHISIFYFASLIILTATFVCLELSNRIENIFLENSSDQFMRIFVWIPLSKVSLSFLSILLFLLLFKLLSIKQHLPFGSSIPSKSVMIAALAVMFELFPTTSAIFMDVASGSSVFTTDVDIILYKVIFSFQCFSHFFLQTVVSMYDFDNLIIPFNWISICLCVGVFNFVGNIVSMTQDWIYENDTLTPVGSFFSYAVLPLVLVQLFSLSRWLFMIIFRLDILVERYNIKTLISISLLLFEFAFPSVMGLYMRVLLNLHFARQRPTPSRTLLLSFGQYNILSSSIYGICSISLVVLSFIPDDKLLSFVTKFKPVKTPSLETDGFSQAVRLESIAITGSSKIEFCDEMSDLSSDSYYRENDVSESEPSVSSMMSSLSSQLT